MTLQAQPSAQGLAAAYMGNPAALQQKINKEPQAAPGIPADLNKLLAMNIITNEQDAAKRQEALQQLHQLGGPAGQPPTVAQSVQEQAKQKLQAQMLQQQRQQEGLRQLAQHAPSQDIPEHTPSPEQQPQGIDNLPADFQFAGGGIVAFAGGDTVGITREVLKELGESTANYLADPAVKSTVDRLVKERIGAAAPTAQAGIQAATQAVDPGMAFRAGQAAGPYLRKAGTLLKSAAVPAIAGGLEAYGALSDMNTAQGFYDDPNVSNWEKAKQAGRTGLKSAVPFATGAIGAGMGSVAAPLVGTLAGGTAGYGLGRLALSGVMDDEGEALKAWRAAHPVAEGDKRQSSTEGVPTAAAEHARSQFAQIDPRRALLQKAIAERSGASQVDSAATANAYAGGAPRENMDPMEKAMRDSIMGAIARKPEDAYAESAARFDKTTGLDALYKEMADRAAAREARYEASKKERTPDWVKGLAALGGAPVRGGLGMLLAKAGAGAEAAREGYQAEDIKFSNEIDALRDAVTKAQMEGNLKKAAAAEQGIKDLLADKRQAEQSGTSLLNTQEQARARRQIAADNALARKMQMEQASDTKKLAAAESAFDRDPEVAVIKKRFEDPMFANNPAEQARAYKRLREIQADKYRMFGIAGAEMTNATPALTSAPPTGSKPQGKL